MHLHLISRRISPSVIRQNITANYNIITCVWIKICTATASNQSVISETTEQPVSSAIADKRVVAAVGSTNALDATAGDGVLPMAGAKGAGLSLMIELITSVLVANPLLSESIEGTALGKRHRQNGLVLAIDISRFGDPAAYAAEVERLVRDIKGLPVDPDTADAAGSRHVLDDDRLPERFLELRRHQPRRHVGEPARLAGDDEADRLAGIVLRHGRHGGGKRQTDEQ